jgi:predicted NUDIX family phosphoesterase
MPRYRQVVIETRQYKTTYILEAKDQQEAEELFALSEWDDEEDSEFLGTIDQDRHEVKEVSEGA